MFKTNDIEVKVFIKQKGSQLGRANIAINTVFGWIELKGFTLWESNQFNSRLQEKINIEPPSARYKTSFCKQVYFDKEKWPEIEMYIYSEYKKELNSISQSNENKGKENVNVDDIPF